MSTILDALRKSEQERNRNKIPTLNDMVAPQEPSRWPLFLVAVIVIFACVLAVLVYMLWSPSDHPIGRGGDASSTSLGQSSPGQLGSEPDVIVNRLDSSVSVSIISYSENDDLSFAIVNGKTVRAGDFVQAGLKVEKVLAGSVLFNQRGKTFEYKP